MHVLVTCKNEKDPIKNEGARVVSWTLPVRYSQYTCKSMRIFPDTEGQLTQQSLVGSDQISNSFKL